MFFHIRSCQSPLKDVSVMLRVMYVVTVIAVGVFTSETKSTVDLYTYIFTRMCTYYYPTKKFPWQDCAFVHSCERTEFDWQVNSST
jgi:hypothetical protein